MACPTRVHRCLVALCLVLFGVFQGTFGQGQTCLKRKDVAFLIELDSDPWSPGRVASFLETIRNRLRNNQECNRVAVVVVSKEAKKMADFECQTLACFNNAIREVRLQRLRLNPASATDVSRQKLLDGIKIISNDLFTGNRKSIRRIVVAVLSNGPLKQNQDFTIEEAFRDVQDVSDEIVVVAVRSANQLKLGKISHSNLLTSVPRFSDIRDSSRINKILSLINTNPPGAFRSGAVAAGGLRAPFLPLQVDLEQNCNQYLVDIGFLVDSSGSLKADYDKEKFFVQRLATRFNISEVGSHGGVIIFSDIGFVTTYIKFDYYHSSQKFNEAVENLPFYGYRTRIDLAMKLANEELFALSSKSRPNVKKVAFLITDGRQNPDQENGVKLSPVKEAEALHKRGIQLFAVGVGKQVNFTELTAIVGSKERVYSVSNFVDLVSDKFVQSVSKALCEAAENGNIEEVKEVPCNTTKPVETHSKCNGSCSTCCGTKNIYMNVFNGNAPAYIVQGVQIVQSGSIGANSGISFPLSNALAGNFSNTPTSPGEIIPLLKKLLPYQKRLTTSIEALLAKANQKPEQVINRRRRDTWNYQSVADALYSNGAAKFSQLVAKHNIYRLISKLSRGRESKQILVFAPSDEAMKSEFPLHITRQATNLLLQHHVGIKDDEAERVMKCADGKHYLKFYSSNLGEQLHPNKIEDADILRGPFPADDALVYIISRVLHPCKPTLRELVHRRNDLSMFAGLMRATGLWRDMQHPMRVNNFCAGHKSCVASDAFRHRYDEVVKRRQYSILAPTNDALLDYIGAHPNYTHDDSLLKEGLASHILHGTLLRDSVAPEVARCDASIAKSNVMRCVATTNGTELVTNFQTTKPHIKIIGSKRADDGVLYIVGSYKPMVVEATQWKVGDLANLNIPH